MSSQLFKTIILVFMLASLGAHSGCALPEVSTTEEPRNWRYNFVESRQSRYEHKPVTSLKRGKALAILRTSPGNVEDWEGNPIEELKVDQYSLVIAFRYTVTETEVTPGRTNTIFTPGQRNSYIFVPGERRTTEETKTYTSSLMFWDLSWLTFWEGKINEADQYYLVVQWQNDSKWLWFRSGSRETITRLGDAIATLALKQGGKVDPVPVTQE